MEAKKALIAAGERHVGAIACGIPESFEIVHASTLTSAIGYVSTGVDVVVCDVGFDELQMFDLLGYMKRLSAPVLIVCVHCGDTELDPLAEALIDVAAASAGAAGFVNMQNNKVRTRKQFLLHRLIAESGNISLV